MKLHIPPALKNRRYFYLWLGLLISIAGGQMQISALFWHIRSLTGDPNPLALGGIGLARILPVIFFSLISGPDPVDRREEAFALLVQSLREICAHAEKSEKIPIVLETFDCEIEKRCLIGPSSDALRLVNDVSRDFPQFSLMLDLSHLPLLHERPTESLRILKGHIGHIHLGNCVLADKNHPAYGDSHPPLGIPGGENDVDEVADFLKGLFEVGYLGEGRRPRVSLEVRPRPGDDADAVLAGSKRVLLEAWARI